MSKYLPYSEFKWLNKKEIGRLDVNSVEKNSDIYYILKLDLEFPEVLHELHNDYPEKLEMIHDIVNEYGIKIGGVHKLVSNLGNKSKYVLHYRNIRLYLSYELS